MPIHPPKNLSKDQKKDLLKFLRAFPAGVQARALWLRDFVWDLYPTANELIYDNYNALAFGWSVTDRVGHLFCNIAVGRSSYNVHFGFYYGSALRDDKKILKGEGTQYRYIPVTDVKKFPAAYIRKLLKEAYAFSRKKVKDESQIKEGLTITKSISAVRRPVAKRLQKKPVRKIAGKKARKRKK